MHPTTVRKRTVFKTCIRHDWIMQERRSRRAEFFMEGGPTGGPCTGGRCRIWPGTDLFYADLCQGGLEFELDWYCNK